MQHQNLATTSSAGQATEQLTSQVPSSQVPSSQIPSSQGTISRPPIWKWFLLAGVLVVALGWLSLTLRQRPDATKPQQVWGDSADASFRSVVERVDQAMYLQIQQAQLQVCEPAESLTIARRLSLALVGSCLSLEEIRTLEQIPESERVQWWTNHLLTDSRWSDYFSQRLSRAYVGTHQGPFLLFRRRKFNAWLAEQLEKGTPYDEIVRQMIAAEGLWTDTPAVNFVTATMDEQRNRRADPVRLAGRTSRAFLAMRIDCLQCHDDVLQKTNFGSLEIPREGSQRDFHALAAFYSGTAVNEPIFRGIREDRQDYKAQLLDQPEEQLVAAGVPFASELLPAEGKPRRRLAAWVTHRDNRAFARATVNRIWALLFGRALVEPVDDIPLVGEVPPALDLLAEDFASHGFNLRRLIAQIVQTGAFQRDSRASFEITAQHEHLWAAFPLVQLRPDQIAASMNQASRLTAIDENSLILVQLQTFGDSQEFIKRFGDRGEDEFDSEPVTITQRLLLMNGKLTAERTKVDLVGNAGSRIAAFVSDDDEAIQTVFLSVFNRYPSAAELHTFREHLQHKRGNARARAIADMTWAMLNATEFSWNH